MRAGPLRHTCALMQARQVKRPGGGRDETWVQLRNLRAEITVPSGRIQVVADGLEAVVSAEIRVRYRADIVSGLRLVHKETTYLIEAALPDNERDMLRLLCSSVTNP